MLRKLFRILVVSVLGLALLVAALFGVLLVVNLKDQLPSPAVAELQALLDDSPIEVESDENAYLLMLGFGAAPDESPMRVGRERYAWMRNSGTNLLRAEDPHGENFDWWHRSGDDVRTLALTCASPTECGQAFEGETNVGERWLRDGAALHERYRSLLKMPHYRGPDLNYVMTPSPFFGTIQQGRRLYFASLWLAAKRGDATSVTNGLDADLEFWRRVVRDANYLLPKMLAAELAKSQFKYGTMVLEQLPPEAAMGAVPASWRRALDDNERSMRRSVAGEWAFNIASQQYGMSDDFYAGSVLDGNSPGALWERLVQKVAARFYQPQDTSNHIAALMLDIGPAYDVPLTEFDRVTESFRDGLEPTHEPFSLLYNPIGDVVVSLAHTVAVMDYAPRVADIEGVRRAALAAVSMRADDIPPDDIPRRLATSGFTNPYDGTPLTWDPDAQAVVFQGRERTTRARHAIPVY